jgi:hypothetical protein
MLVLPYGEAVGRGYGIKRHGSWSSNSSIPHSSTGCILPSTHPAHIHLTRMIAIHPLHHCAKRHAAYPILQVNSPAGVLNPSPTSLNHRFVLVLTFFPPIDSNQVHHERERDRKARMIVDDVDITYTK